MAIQSSNGKAFEFACLNSLNNHLIGFQQVIINKTSTFNIANAAYNDATANMKQNMTSAADAAIDVIMRLEPQLVNPMNNNPLYLSIQEDAIGITGDVRDVISARMQNEWEIGISCKHNHSAVKHSRLSGTIDFGNSWLQTPCSLIYFGSINPLFDELKDMRLKGLQWKQIIDKESRFYVPLLDAFMAELKKLYQENPNIPSLLLKYLLGMKDFYKIITHDSRRLTQIQAFNLYNTLNRNAGNVHPQVRIPQLTLPSAFFSIDYKPGSKNTIHIHCDHGWAISLRIHSASTLVEPSLKFDATLIGVPTGLYTHFEPWN